MPFLPWGTHFCQFYRTGQDLLEILVPYFRSGLEHNELCLWVTSDRLTVPEAVEAMRAQVTRFDDALREEQIEIVSYEQWYLQDGTFDPERVLAGWITTVAAARTRGYDGLRLSGDTFWLDHSLWRDFADYEAAVQRVIGDYPMLALCTYCLDKCGPLDVIEVVAAHQLALVKQQDTWKPLEPSQRRAAADAVEKANDALVHDLVSAQRYTRSLIEASLDPLVTISTAGKITDVNEATIKATGVPREELVGTDFADYFTEPDKARAGYQQAFHLGTVRDYPLVLRHVSGTTVHVHYNASVYRDDTSQVRGVFAAARDVTARNRAEASARRLAAIVESSDDAIISKTLDGTILSWNPGAEALYGYSANEIVGRSVTVLVPPDRREELRDLMRRVAGGEHVAHVETTRVPRDGPPLDISLTVSPLRDTWRQVIGVSTIARDITERKRAERRLKDASAYNRSLIEASLDPLVTISSAGKITDVNEAAIRATGVPREGLIGNDFSGYFTDPDFARAGYERVFREGTVHDYALELRHRDGHTTPVLYNASLYRDASGEVLGVLAAARDVTAQRAAETQLVQRALHDELTGMPNRALLLDHLSAALARARRTSSLVGLLFLDLDDFKSINDSYGHVMGDEFLVHVGESISGCLREADLAARIGGDEFVVVCEGLIDPSDAETLAERIQHALGSQIPLGGHQVSAPVSIGIAIGHDASTPEELLRDADAAMYVAKHHGGRRWEPADLGLHAAALRVLTLEGELRQAIQRDEFLVYYQPIIDLSGGRLVAVEALLRWQHPEHGLLLPEAFLDVAEQRNLIGEIGAWVLATACTQAAAWAGVHGAAAPALAVNVSSRQLGNQGLAALVGSTLAGTGLTADRLCLEITESQLIAVAGSATTDLNTLAAAGVRIAVDDFGTGYSGFDYLRKLPVNELKIDKSFVDRLGVDATDTAITSSIIALGRSLHLTVVAEGIQTAEQRDLLHELGCTWGQGWLWHPARPAAEIDALLTPGPAQTSS